MGRARLSPKSLASALRSPIDGFSKVMWMIPHAIRLLFDIASFILGAEGRFAE
jgi:hypothetical protein